MPLERYIDRRFSAKSLDMIEKANAIIAEYDELGFQLTLRQLYYQFVARGLIPNSQREYKNLGSVVNDGRLAGLIDWNAIEDRTRNVRTLAHWESPEEIVSAVAAQFRLDKWEDQPIRVEVWVEKDALLGVIEPACTEMDVSYFACRGYSSQSEQWRAGKRFAKWQDEGKEVVVIHLGDHDPSGIDMTRDNRDRLQLFGGVDIKVIRIALNYDQVEQYNPPPNPTKLSDSRAEGYVESYGESCWELDALDPRVIDRLIRDEIERHLDRRLWARAEKREEQHKRLLQQVASKWDDVARFVHRQK